MINQYEITLPHYPRGYHLITHHLQKAIEKMPKVGLVNVFIKHTSAGLTINENADSDVRVDFESIFNKIVPENLPFLKHTMEGADDMPAHIKTALVGTAVSIPITNFRFNLGTWQGVYLCEFRNYPSRRKLVITVYE
jgi:secondary thiamine-phosphate synthase enzyme